MIDASSLDSLLFDCVNHSKYNENLKQRLRDNISKKSKSENLKLEYKKVVGESIQKPIKPPT
jgi:acyl-ACP thioesterase